SLVGGRQALAGYRCGLIITDRLIDIADVPPLSVVYRPRSLVVGVGCNRRTESAEIEEAISAALAEARLSPRSIRNLATIEGKRDEAGLRECAARNGWAIDYFTADELNAIGGISDPSPMAFREVGAWGVCEPAALRSAGAGELLVSKRKRGNVTVAIARVQF
ncbi:MAG: cobalamin biosynthesis protein, partial [Chloroflexi bacterium]|nr:cobalamin biosynthesis protein [Chloroflexota bacterium]